MTKTIVDRNIIFIYNDIRNFCTGNNRMSSESNRRIRELEIKNRILRMVVAALIIIMIAGAFILNSKKEKPAQVNILDSVYYDICFDAEDYGTPQWAEKNEDSENTWALGAQYWAKNLPENYKPQFGILLDMVGGQGAKFYQEQNSIRYAASIVDKVWSAARHAGFSSVFANEVGGGVTDDHVPVNEAGIPTVDIIPFYPDCSQSSFGPTWHTVNDDMEHLDINTLKAVGQTLVQVIYSE